jgi:hypothetical protein
VDFDAICLRQTSFRDIAAERVALGAPFAWPRMRKCKPDLRCSAGQAQDPKAIGSKEGPERIARHRAPQSGSAITRGDLSLRVDPSRCVSRFSHDTGWTAVDPCRRPAQVPRVRFPLAPLGPGQDLSACRLRHREQTSRSRQSRTDASAPYRSAISAGSGLDLRSEFAAMLYVVCQRTLPIMSPIPRQIVRLHSRNFSSKLNKLSGRNLGLCHGSSGEMSV